MPRKPKRHDNPKRAIHNRQADPKRTAKRIQSRIRFLSQIAKEREIGSNPMYDHARGRNETVRMELQSAWEKQSREYDERIKKEIPA